MWNMQSRGNKELQVRRIVTHTLITYVIASGCLGGHVQAQDQLSERWVARTKQRLEADNVRKLAQYVGLGIMACADLKPKKAFAKYINSFHIEPDAKRVFDTQDFAAAKERLADVKRIQLAGYDKLSTEYLKFVYVAVSSKGPVVFEMFIFVYEGIPHMHEIKYFMSPEQMEESIEGVNQLPSPMTIGKE